jgi:UDP-hydrolysing UDP-N-acetyl-D-glucosamine 2-epimerase
LSDDAPRKICVVVASRANYARIRTAMEAIRDHASLELQLVVCASALLERFGTPLDVIYRDGFEPAATVRLVVEGESPTTMAQSTGVGLIQLPLVFELLKPDVVLTVADRFETMATAISAAYMNLPLAHTQGGEVSGSIDESVRHAITKLAHLHFPATALSAQRVIAMGEDPRTVFNVGCPSIDIVARTRLALTREELAGLFDRDGALDPHQPYVLLVQHPVTTEYGDSLDQITQSLAAVGALGLPVMVFAPNSGAGSEHIAKGIRAFCAERAHGDFHLFHNLPVETFIRLMANCSCMVGNSSAALREGAFLGTPAVCVGSRQRDRECGDNVVWAMDGAEIADATRDQIRHGRYDRDHLFGDGTAGTTIAETLAAARPPIQKRLGFGLGSGAHRDFAAPDLEQRAPTPRGIVGVEASQP